MDGYANLILRPENNPLATIDIAERNMAMQINQLLTDEYSMLSDGQGFVDTTICIDDDDPWCRIRQVVTPSFINQETLAQTIKSVGGEAMTKADESGEKPSDTASLLQTDVVTTNSLYNYNTEDLQTTSPDFNALYREFYEEIMHGYYDLDNPEKVWAQNALSNITDELYFQMIDQNSGTYGPAY